MTKTLMKESVDEYMEVFRMVQEELIESTIDNTKLTPTNISASVGKVWSLYIAKRYGSDMNMSNLLH